MSCAVLFPGQGTQAPGMGHPWRAHPAWALVERAEAVLGEPVGHLLLEGSESELARTRNAQLSVALVSLMAWEAVRDEMGPPAAFAGHSLGQLTALVAAGALGLEEGIRLIARRAECTQEAADRRPGRMAALIGGSLEQAEAACRPGDTTAAGPDGERSCWVANDNAPGQVVVAGTAAGVDAAAGRAGALGVRKVLPLRVEGAFHTPLMAGARDALSPELAAADFRPATVPVVSNVDARPHRDGADWRRDLADHLVSRVRWRTTMGTLVSLGAEWFVELGPGEVLRGLARRNQPGFEARHIGVPADLPAMMEVCPS